MATCRQIAERIAKRFGAIAPGDDLSVGEVETLLEAIQDEMRRLHEARGPLTEVDVTADYTAGENERVRVQNGYTVAVTLPNSIEITASRRRDYGYAGEGDTPAGSGAIADGTAWRAPRDGSRVEIVGTSQGLYFYRSDTNEWVNCNALAIGGSMPLNAAYLADLACLIAVKVCRDWTGREPTGQMYREEREARQRIYGRPGVRRETVAGAFF